MKSPPYAREGRTCCDRLRGSLRSGDNIATGGSSSRSTENGVGQRTRGSASLPLPIRGGRDKRDPPPVPCTTARAHPSCDRLRGSLRSGDMSPLWIRNRVAVATSATLPPCHARRRGRRRHYGYATEWRSRQARPSPRTMHDGEGAPLLRPLARLTSFGGYVATMDAQHKCVNHLVK